MRDSWAALQMHCHESTAKDMVGDGWTAKPDMRHVKVGVRARLRSFIKWVTTRSLYILPHLPRFSHVQLQTALSPSATLYQRLWNTLEDRSNETRKHCLSPVRHSTLHSRASLPKSGNPAPTLFFAFSPFTGPWPPCKCLELLTHHCDTRAGHLSYIGAHLHLKLENVLTEEPNQIILESASIHP